MILSDGKSIQPYNTSLINSCELLMPSNAAVAGEGIIKILDADLIDSKNKWVKKFHFVYRSLSNPYKLYNYIRKKPGAVVLFNDFDQLTAWGLGTVVFMG